MNKFQLKKNNFKIMNTMKNNIKSVIDIQLINAKKNIVENNINPTSDVQLNNNNTMKNNINPSGVQLNNNTMKNNIKSVIGMQLIKNKNIVENNVTSIPSEIYDLSMIKDDKSCFRIVCNILKNTQNDLVLPLIKQKSIYEAVLIEYRILPHLQFLIKNMIIQLGDEWSHTVVCGTLNYTYMKQLCNSISPTINVILTPYENLNQSSYSLLLSSSKFWNMFYGNKILIYQEDSIIFKKNIKQFLKYDYIGAPWCMNQNDTKQLVGNGGFSLRNKDVMLKAIHTLNIKLVKPNSSTLKYMKKNKIKTCPEDVYFCKTIEDYKLGNIPNSAIASEFSTESILNYDSLGGHNFWLHDNNWINRVLKIYNTRVNLDLLKILCQKYNCVCIANQNEYDDCYLSYIIKFFIKSNYKIIFCTDTNELESISQLFTKEELYSIYLTNYNLLFDINIQSIHFEHVVCIGNIPTIKIVSKYNHYNDVIGKNKEEKFMMFCNEYIPYIKCVELPLISKKNKYETVLIEFNIFPHLEFVIRNTILKLQCNWSHTVICGPNNYDYMTQLCQSISCEINVLLYNEDDLMTDMSFWEKINSEKILFYNKNTILFQTNIDDFLNLDYIISNNLVLVNKNILISAIEKNIVLKIKTSLYELDCIVSKDILLEFSKFGNDIFWECNTNWKKLYNIREHKTVVENLKIEV